MVTIEALREIATLQQLLLEFRVEPEVVARVTGQTTWREIEAILEEKFMSFITELESILGLNITDETVARDGPLEDLHPLAV